MTYSVFTLSLWALFIQTGGLNVNVFSWFSIINKWFLDTSEYVPFHKDFLNTTELIRREGFLYETYDVTTEDEYIVKLTRIVPPEGDLTLVRPSVLMVHGVLASSDQWILKGRNEDLAFILSTTGFDVWLADLRGNYYAKNHTLLSPTNEEYWKFSFHEIGFYDLPALVDHVLNVTGFEELNYIGHSMGCTTFLILCSLRPEYNRKITSSVLLAPVGPKYPLREQKNPIVKLLLADYELLFAVAVASGIHEFFPRNPALVNTAIQVCDRQDHPSYGPCLDVISSIVGIHKGNFYNQTLFFTSFIHIPAGTSSRTVRHLALAFNNGFRMYDYGPQMNAEKYNSTQPPLYPLEMITAPTFLVHGKNDPYTHPEVVKYLSETVPGVVQSMLLEDPDFTHLDFLFGSNTKEVLHPPVLQFLLSYNKLMNEL